MARQVGISRYESDGIRLFPGTTLISEHTWILYLQASNARNKGGYAISGIQPRQKIAQIRTGYDIILAYNGRDHPRLHLAFSFNPLLEGRMGIGHVTHGWSVGNVTNSRTILGRDRKTNM